MTEGYRYTACGLDYVYLANGYAVHETPQGRGVAIKDARKLHEAIACAIVSGGRKLRGMEVRFLRGMLRLSQEGLAQAMGQRRGSVARWEAAPEKAIPPTADRFLRMFYALKADGREVAARLVDLLTELDDSEHRSDTLPKLTLEEIDRDWQVAA